MTKRQLYPIVLVLLHTVAFFWFAEAMFPRIAGAHGDIGLYFDYSLNVAQGQVPYRDFSMEYPPLALVAFAAPRLLAFGALIDAEAYRRLFLLENVFFSTIIAIALVQMLRLWQPERSPTMPLIVYTSFVVLTSPLSPWRYDMFPTFLTALALLAFIDQRTALAGFWLGLGAAAKLYPLVLLGIFGAAYLASGQWRAIMRMGVTCVVVIAACLLPFVWLAPETWSVFLTYHQERGLQIESLAGAVVWLAATFDLTQAEKVFNYGALHVDGSWADALLLWQSRMLVLMVIAVGLACLWRFRTEYTKHGAVSHDSVAAGVVAVLLAFMVGNKVFSPQYVVWLLPFIPLLRPLPIVILGLICMSTIYIFPFNYAAYLEQRPALVMLLNVRNVLALILIPWLLFASVSALRLGETSKRGVTETTPVAVK
jgi:uncharacterized membrane protein